MARYDDDTLTGTLAFEMLLDKLVEVQKERLADAEAKIASLDRARGLEAQIAMQATKIDGLEARLSNFTSPSCETAIVALYDAVERAVTRLSAIKTDDEIALVENLKTSMAAAKKFIDPIPF